MLTKLCLNKLIDRYKKAIDEPEKLPEKSESSEKSEGEKRDNIFVLSYENHLMK